MKHIAIFLLVLVLSFACQSQNENQHHELSVDQPTRTPIELLKDFEGHPVVFYNVENLFDTLDTPGKNDTEFTPTGSKKWGTERYLKKLTDLAEVIATPENHQPLMVGLVEIENLPVVVDLLKTPPLDQSTFRVAHFESPDRRGIDVALGYDAQRFFVVHKEAVPIKTLNFPTRDILYVKGFLKDSLEMHVFVNHWPSRRGGAERSEVNRVAAARVLRAKVDSLLAIDPNNNILIMGDFNDEPDDLSITSTLKARRPGGKLKSKDLVNLSFDKMREGKGTFVWDDQWNMLDQFIVSQGLFFAHHGLAVEGNEKHIMDDEKFLYQTERISPRPNKTFGRSSYFGGYSDHLAIYLYLTRNKK